MELALSKLKYRQWRRLAILDEGYIALVPSDTELFDEIWVLADVSVPMVLREGSNGIFRLIGEW